MTDTITNLIRITGELKRVEQKGETITAELAQAAVERAFQIGKVTAFREMRRRSQIAGDGAE